MTCQWEVDSGVGRTNAVVGDTGYAQTPYVDETPFDYDPDTDPPPAHTYVEDLTHAEISPGALFDFFHAQETLSVDPPAVVTDFDGFSKIRLFTPTQLGESGRRLARWRFRVSDVLASTTFTTFTYEYRLYPFTRQFLSDYQYILTAADLAEGWTYPDPQDIPEYLWIGGEVRSPRIGWRLTFQGDGDVKLGITLDGDLLAETSAFALTTDWYTVQFLAEGTIASAKIWADGDTEPGSYQVSDTVDEVTDYPDLYIVDGSGRLFRDTPDLWVEWDQAEIWGSG